VLGLGQPQCNGRPAPKPWAFLITHRLRPGKYAPPVALFPLSTSLHWSLEGNESGRECQRGSGARGGGISLARVRERRRWMIGRS